MPDLPIPQAGRDIVTPLVASILRDAGDSAYRKLVVSGATPTTAHRALDGVQPETLLARSVRHPDDARAALAGLWLWHDALDECHRIVQEIAMPTGSFWHAIMHRREGDFSNSKYWYNRCRGHHAMKMMGSVASSLAGGLASDGLVARTISGGWDPSAFVDLVAEVDSDPADPRHDLAIRLQRVEWETLFDYCARDAVQDDRTYLDDWDRRAGKMGAGT